MSVARGTTPTFKLQFANDIELPDASRIWVTFDTGVGVFTKKDTDLIVEGHTINVYLNQQECFKLREGEVAIQANWLTPQGRRVATEIAKYPITKQLLNEVIT